MRGVFAQLNKKDDSPTATTAPTLKVAPADSDYQSTLIKLVSDSKMRLEALKRRASHETILSPLPSPMNVIEEEDTQDPPTSLAQLKKRAPRLNAKN
jgi:hypothetical protein